MGVTQLVKSPLVMLAPTMALKVLQHMIKHKPPRKASDPIPAFKPIE